MTLGTAVAEWDGISAVWLVWEGKMMGKNQWPLHPKSRLYSLSAMAQGGHELLAMKTNCYKWKTWQARDRRWRHALEMR